MFAYMKNRHLYLMASLVIDKLFGQVALSTPLPLSQIVPLRQFVPDAENKTTLQNYFLIRKITLVIHDVIIFSSAIGKSRLL